jgi:hypothetical protein
MGRMCKALRLIGIVALAVFATSNLSAQIPCPVMLVSGNTNQDTITLSFRNKGKLPIEQLILSCSPSPYRKTGNSSCHTENGVFFPGMQYSINLAYPNAGKRQVILSVREAVLSSGAHWDFSSSDKCRSLRVSSRTSR